jgi:ABC-2 type transport system permease protein
MIVTWLTGLLGGELIPLSLFPPWLERLVEALPFAAIFSTPLSIYVGTIGPADYARALGIQVLWIAVFAGIAAIVWRAGARRIVVQGG